MRATILLGCLLTLIGCSSVPSPGAPSTGTPPGGKTDDGQRVVRTCLFGETLADLEANEGLEKEVTIEYTARSIEIQDAFEGARIVAAFRTNSVNEGVATVEDALAATDDGKISLQFVSDAQNRRFDVISYSSGDNVYGAIFWTNTSRLAAIIGDSDISECTVEDVSDTVCAFGSDLAAFKASPDFRWNRPSDLTQESDLSELAKKQIIMGVHAVGYAADDIDGAFDVANAPITRTAVLSNVTHQWYTVFESISDESIFAFVFRTRTLDLVATFQQYDEDEAFTFENCRVRASAPPTACLFGSQESELEGDDDFSFSEEIRVFAPDTEPSSITDLEKEQLLLIGESMEATTVLEVIESTDAARVYAVELSHPETARSFTYFKYMYSGHQAVTIFLTGTTEVVGEGVDGELFCDYE